MLDAFLHAARASKTMGFGWRHLRQFAKRLLSDASPRAIVLASPHIPWPLIQRGDLVQQWAAAASAVPYTEEIAQSVVDTLLQIASERRLLPHIPADVWSWLIKRPSLPPICRGRFVGTHLHVVRAVRALENIEVFKSYLLLTWSEWNNIWLESIREIGSSVREDFGGTEMGHHRADLILRLDHILGQLDRVLGHLSQQYPGLGRSFLWTMKAEYKYLKKVLQETNIKAIARTSRPVVAHL